MTAPSETRLVTYFIAQLNQLGSDVYFWRSSTGAARTPTRLLRFGVPGQADILGVGRGRFFAIEVKTERGKQSALQREFQCRVEEAGGVYILARTLREALDPVLQVINL